MADPSQMNMVRISQKAGGSVFCEPVFRYPSLPGEETSRQKMLEVLADEIGDGVWRLALVVAELPNSSILKRLRPQLTELELWPEQQWPTVRPT